MTAKQRCAICGRVTLNPAVMLGAEPIGPKCAKRAGLLKLKGRRGSRVTSGVRRFSQPDRQTLDLFDAIELAPSLMRTP